MKKLTICLLFAVSSLLMQSCSESTESRLEGNLPESEVPAAVKTAFASKYPGATEVEWEKEVENNQTVYEVEFELNDEEFEATFDENGNFIEAEED